MKRKSIKDVFIGFMIGCFLMTTTPVLADSIIQKIDVVLNTIKVEVNGEKLESNSILYNGSTYLPLRKVAEAVGKEVEWNQNTMTANIINTAKEVNDVSDIVVTEEEYQNFIKEFDIEKMFYNEVDDYYVTTVAYYKNLTLDELKQYLNITNNPKRNEFLKRLYEEVTLDDDITHYVRFHYRNNNMNYFLGVITKENEKYIIDFTSCDI